MLIGEMITSEPIRKTCPLLASVTPFDVVLTTPPNAVSERAMAIGHSEARGQALRLPVRADLIFRLKSLLMAGAVVLAARIAAALFAKR
jgi:hypothetical protein